ncbi:MAG TPA: DUF6752 domain-containing protein [Nocardioides sp.]|nr:DUF6752 domain-containing protein [Nocardioides sp.]
MTRTLYLHVGSPKSGTTYLQRILDANRDVLAAAGVLVVGSAQVDRVQAALQVREDPRWEKLPEARRDMWGTLVAEIRAWQGDSAILSYELFCAASAEQSKRALADLDGIDVHVVVTARDLAGAVPSAWQEQLKFGTTKPLEEWSPAGRNREWGWRTLDPSSVAKRWGASLPADHVHVVTVPAQPTTDSELWERFAAACGVTDVAVDLAVPRVNESLGVVQAELLRRVNGHLRAPLEGSRERAVWLRDTLAHGVLAAGCSSAEPIGLTDAQLTEATQRAESAITAIEKAGYAVHGDLADLRPTQRDARMPGEVSEADLLLAAQEAIVELLVLVRERTREGRGRARATATPGARGLGRRIVERATAPYVGRRERDLRARIEALEAEVARERALHLRVASLQNVVAELLLPADLRDNELTEKALRTYRRSIR